MGKRSKIRLKSWMAGGIAGKGIENIFIDLK